MRRQSLPVLALAALLLPGSIRAEETARKPTFEIYGFAQVDYIQDFKRMPSDWDATLRPSRIPTTDEGDGQAIFSARQSRLGVRGSIPVGDSDLFGRVEFDFFGRGTGQPDSAGQNTLRLRQAYGSWGPILGGLTASLFMDDDLWPNIVDYWGPCGMAFYRNVQIRYTFLTGTHTLAIAVERPGADLQNYPNVPALQDLASDNKIPDFTAQYRLSQAWGYVQASGILRRLGYDTGAGGIKGSKFGWGLNGSSTIKILPDRLKLLVAVVGGAGIENYMNDATPDLAIDGTFTAPTAAAVPMLGLTGYVDISWTKVLTTAIGYSTVFIFNTSLQPNSALKRGQYASVNLLVSPFRNFLAGPEFLWGRRNDLGGAYGDDFRLQVSLKYSFSSLDFWKPS
ncbi:MAG TPA: DcaP family trimeric outer membrane transporter [Myxococcaceae bacterium]|nr:DcaP family trimeric outer membrane transporter [Myxococcaceae bacterium]